MRRLAAALALVLAAALAGALLGGLWAPLDSLAVPQLYLAAALLLLASFPILPAALRPGLGALACLGAWDVLSHAVTPDAVTGAPVLRHLQHNLHQGNRAADLPERLAGVDTATLQEVGEAIFTLSDLPPEWHLEICPRPGWVTTAALTRHPVIASGCTPSGAAWIRLRLPEGVGAPGAELTLVSVHVFWPWPAAGDRQTQQVAGLRAELSALPGPVLLGGDFNQMPWSAAVGTLADSVGAKVAPGLRATYVDLGGALRLPIDHILAPRGWQVAAVRGERHGSDHHAVTATLHPRPLD
ncbi:endonuclease/exonuclease/phosphatase family protein [Jannaschia formosa]|uniref:endonuclease/exonuclease/phosphatase family protein n=1 Tax=Jannaschia formosa TaxID=2259592 RepID=UPI000E1BD595|nr:endonuclease/exonuclease/phosphatase family protein [Jannaschia formosa]TFL17812.1 hypothetical protein DR046_13010 [Jannaschia formosa]